MNAITLKSWPASLFGRTSLTIALTLLAFFLITASAMVYFVLMPMAKRSAEDLAAEIVTASKALQSMPASRQTSYREELEHDHGIVVARQVSASSTPAPQLLFMPYFREALEKHSDGTFAISGTGSSPLVWVRFQNGDNVHELGFDRDRLGINLSLALLLAVGGGAALTLTTSLLDVRRITRHLDNLSAAARALGKGRKPKSIPVGGPTEIAELARTFNQMSADLQRLEQNRNVMIAGLSHDLRTPLTRLNLAVEMLDEDSDRHIVARIRRNLAVMNAMISQFIMFSRGVETAKPVKLQLPEFIESLLVDFKAEGVEVQLKCCQTPATYIADRDVLERVLVNLLKNAVQYGQGAPVNVTLKCGKEGGAIEIADRGPGIPPDKLDLIFEPFQRLDPARSVRPGGSGLGLAIAQQLASTHGWAIELIPRDGGGTIARLTLPPAQP